MKAKVTLSTFKAMLLLGTALLIGSSASATFVPVPVTGYNADVVANGVGTALSSISADVDGTGFAFVASDYNALGVIPTSYMPTNNTVYSVATSGVMFQL